MNSIRQIQELNRRELENNVPPNASWHADYRDTAYVYIGGLPFELSEGDIITIFSQYGEPTYINLIRDKETGKSKGFAFLKYEDQRSTDLAVDNLGGSVIMGRTLKVDHTRYKRKEGEEEQGIDLEGAWKHTEDGDGDEDGRRKRRRTSVSESEDERPMLKEERELAKLIQDHDEDDPMKTFLVEEKKEEVVMALGRLKEGKSHGETRMRGMRIEMQDVLVIKKKATIGKGEGHALRMMHGKGIERVGILSKMDQKIARKEDGVRGQSVENAIGIEGMNARREKIPNIAVRGKIYKDCNKGNCIPSGNNVPF